MKNDIKIKLIISTCSVCGNIATEIIKETQTKPNKCTLKRNEKHLI